jgi:RNA polymerase sigma factor (sigma-70 family)
MKPTTNDKMDYMPLIRGIQSNTNLDDCYAHLLKAFKPMINGIIYKKAKYPKSILPDDLFQEASIALFNSAMKYSEANGAKFSTYAHNSISHAIYNYIALNQGSVTISMRESNKMKPLRAFASRFHDECGCYPELSDYIKNGYPEADAKAFLDFISATCMSSGLTYDDNTTDSEEYDFCSYDDVEDEADYMEEQECTDYSNLYRSIDKLTKNQQHVIRGLFFEGKTAAEIAKELDIDVSIVSKHKTNALAKLKELLGEETPGIAKLKQAAGIPDATNEHVMNAIYALPKKQKDVIIALFVENMRPGAVAEKLDIPSYAVSKYAAAAIKQIKAIVEEPIKPTKKKSYDYDER